MRGDAICHAGLDPASTRWPLRGLPANLHPIGLPVDSCFPFGDLRLRRNDRKPGCWEINPTTGGTLKLVWGCLNSSIPNQVGIATPRDPKDNR